jgi:hypothetical protein
LTEGLESSPAAEALAGLRANEARYYKNKCNYDFTVNDAADDKGTVEYVRLILEIFVRHTSSTKIQLPRDLR